MAFSFSISTHTIRTVIMLILLVTGQSEFPYLSHSIRINDLQMETKSKKNQLTNAMIKESLKKLLFN